MPVDESKTEFKVVFIPADRNAEVVEQIVKIEPGHTIEAMTNHVKEHIAKLEDIRKGALSLDEMKQERLAIGDQIKKMAQEQPSLRDLNITDDIITRIYLSNAVDAVPLLVNKPSNGYVAVNLYVDDQGMTKQLPINERATTLCYMVGKPLQVLGDAFVAKYMDNDDDFVRYDFGLDDLVNKTWIEEAKKSNHTEDTSASSGVKVVSTKPDHLKTYTQPQPAHAHRCGDGHIRCTNNAPHRCNRCKSIFYCSVEHQREDWKRHKIECQPMV